MCFCHLPPHTFTDARRLARALECEKQHHPLHGVHHRIAGTLPPGGGRLAGVGVSGGVVFLWALEGPRAVEQHEARNKVREAGSRNQRSVAALCVFGCVLGLVSAEGALEGKQGLGGGQPPQAKRSRPVGEVEGVLTMKPTNQEWQPLKVSGCGLL